MQQVAAVPQQFHFHAHSEHLLQGEQQRLCTSALDSFCTQQDTPCRKIAPAACWLLCASCSVATLVPAVTFPL